jgi:hypothetical protein
MTWNLEGILCSGRELLALLNFLTANDVDISIITEAEIPASGYVDFNVEGYPSYLLHSSDLLKSAKYRVVALVRAALATSTKVNLMHAAVQSVWNQLNSPSSRYSWTSGYLGPDRQPLQGVVEPCPGDDRPVQGQGAVTGGIRGGGPQHGQEV